MMPWSTLVEPSGSEICSAAWRWPWAAKRGRGSPDGLLCHSAPIRCYGWQLRHHPPKSHQWRPRRCAGPRFAGCSSIYLTQVCASGGEEEGGTRLSPRVSHGVHTASNLRRPVRIHRPENGWQYLAISLSQRFCQLSRTSIQYLGLTTWLCGISAIAAAASATSPREPPIPVADHSAHSTPCRKACDRRLLANGANEKLMLIAYPIEDISVMQPCSLADLTTFLAVTDCLSVCPTTS
jgi:hypothetical protein